MRMTRPRRREVRTESIVLTGGLNEVVTSLELEKGELQQCLNYTEMDGPYHGYTSIEGFEVYDGKQKPSDVSVPQLIDMGIDDDCVLLLTAEEEYTDTSGSGHVVVNQGTSYDTTVLKFESGSFNSKFGSVQVNATNSGEFGPGFSSAFYQEDISTRSYLNLLDNWTVDFQIKPTANQVGTQTVFEKKLAYKLDITDGILTFHISSDGAAYDYSITAPENTLSTTLFTHVSIACKDDTLRIAFNGTPATETGTVIEEAIVPIWQNVIDLFIGADFDDTQNYTGHWDEFRISLGYRWITDFQAPTVRYRDGSYEERNWDDVDRELQRQTITEVPGVGNVLGCHVYDNELYALRNADLSNASLWKAKVTGDDLTAGWELVDDTFNANGKLHAFNNRFSGNYSDQLVMVMVDHMSIPRVWDGTTMSLMTDATLPDNDTVLTPRYAKLCATFDGRILLAYAEDDIFLSAKDTVTDFSGGFGTQLNIGDDITNLRELPGETMAVICATSIKMLTKLETASGDPASPDYTFKVDTFSKQAGGFESTCERVLSRVLYADDRGVVSLATTDKYGDFDAAAISKKVNRIYLAKRHMITASIVSKELNQYRLYFSDGTGLVFTFLDEELKGATFIDYGQAVLFATEGKIDGENVRFFTSDTGFVYQMDSGTSLNGLPISTKMFTSFYHYKSPRYWKQFMRMVFEITASNGTVFTTRPVFDYDAPDFPETQWWESLLKGAGGVYGVDNWGSFIWTGAVVQRVINYIRGHGTNMSIELRTNSKYTKQHIVHNVIVDYQVENIQE